MYFFFLSSQIRHPDAHISHKSLFAESSPSSLICRLKTLCYLWHAVFIHSVYITFPLFLYSEPSSYITNSKFFACFSIYLYAYILVISTHYYCWYSSAPVVSCSYLTAIVYHWLKKYFLQLWSAVLYHWAYKCLPFIQISLIIWIC